jgi:nitrite reductase (NADH) small subunit
MSVAVQLDYAPAPSEPRPNWHDICALEDIPVNCGAPALIEGRQIAVVRIEPAADDRQEVFALSNFDPFSEAFVIARGIVGDRAGCPKIASPIYKQSFDLRTGVCFDDPSVVLATYGARVRNGRIEVALGDDHLPLQSALDIGSGR